MVKATLRSGLCNSLFYSQSDLEVLIYNWIHKQHLQFSNFENPAKLISQKSQF